MNGHDSPHVPRRRAAALALRRAANPARRVTELLALFFVVGSLESAVRIALDIGYDPFSLQEAVSILATFAATLAAFVLLGKLPWATPRTLLALAAMPAATAAVWLVERWVYGDIMRGLLWFEVGRAAVLAALLFGVVHLIAGTIALVGALAGPDAYLGEDRQPSRDRREERQPT